MMQAISRPFASTPAELHQLWMEAMNRGDLEALVELYESDAVMVLDRGGPVLEGRVAIREALAPHVAAGARVENSTSEELVGDDLAYLRSSWRLATSGPDGEPLTMEGSGAEIARRQPDGRWLLALDHAFGAACPPRNREVSR